MHTITAGSTNPLQTRKLSVIPTAALAAVSVGLILSPSGPAHAASGWWLDDINASLFLLSGRLDGELEQMRAQGADTVLVQADVLPGPVLSHIAGRARAHQLQPVAWIQFPSRSRLQHAAGLKSYTAVQVDDHFFHHPPLPISDLRRQLDASGKELWCSFQPGQLNWERVQSCHHIDVQLYRQGCREVERHARRLGLPDLNPAAVAVYHDGSSPATGVVACQQQASKALGIGTLVFKWKNPETALGPLWRHPLVSGSMAVAADGLNRLARLADALPASR